ncbi:MAG: 1-deoxy-D-xylulose-5-phosphate synthase, partial [Clostridia bacterium]|nr:1-deoxy-D-xylulose-5-phosphate synthase [Clostridia bacterium]
QGLPVVLALDRGGLVGEDGETHHGVFDLSYLGCVPGLVLMAPKDENELRHMLLTAVEYDGPVALRYPRGRGVGVAMDESLKTIPIGKGEVLAEGEDLAFFAVGNHVKTALNASEILKGKGINSTVINARFVKPLDRELLLDTAEKTGRVITIEENAARGGFGSSVLGLLADAGLKDVKLTSAALPDVFVTHGSTDILREELGLTPEKIVGKVRESFKELF